MPCSISVAFESFMTESIPNIVYKHLREKSIVESRTGNEAMSISFWCCILNQV
jgi:hypothetical protein